MAPEGGGSHPYLGGFFLVAGAGALTFAFLPASMVTVPVDLPSVQGVPGEVAVAGVAGILFLAVAVRLLGGSPTAAGGEVQEGESTASLERKPNRNPPTSPTGTTVDRSGQGSNGAQTKEEKRMDALEEKIKAIDRRMSQAKVKLGTGELSPEGYQKVMEELEEKRAQLEKERVDLELDQSDL